MHKYTKTAIAGIAGAVLGIVPLAQSAMADGFLAGRTTHNWALEIDGHYLNPGDTFVGELRTNRDGEIRLHVNYGDRVVMENVNCGASDRQADVRVDVEADGRFWITCF